MHFVIVSKIIFRFALILLVVTCVACGGGTTGTSPTDTLRFSGFVEQADGTRASSIAMTIRSGVTEDNLLESATNEQGEFSMNLPASEQALIIEAQGVGSTMVMRDQRGDGAITAKLGVTSQGQLLATLISELQIKQSSLCSSLSPSENGLTIVGDVGQEPCLVTISVASQELPIEQFIGTLTAVCSNVQVDLEISRASQQGEILYDLNRAFSLNCSDIQLKISHGNAPELVAIFIVE
jgi:hypothetical protein